MRSRSEDALDAFDLLCSPVDSIRSHFRSSYAMVVNILRTKDLESCKVPIHPPTHPPTHLWIEEKGTVRMRDCSEHKCLFLLDQPTHPPTHPLQVLVERSFGNYLKAYSLGEEQETDLAKRGR